MQEAPQGLENPGKTVLIQDPKKGQEVIGCDLHFRMGTLVLEKRMGTEGHEWKGS